MRMLVPLLTLAVICCAVPAATAEPEPQPGPGRKLSFPAVTWQKGDLSTISGRLGHEVVYSPEFGKEDERSKRYESDGWIAALRADAVDKAGVVTKGVAWFESGFIMSNRGRDNDQTLGGVRADLADGRWSEAGGNSDPSAKAERWLSDRFAKQCLREAQIDWLAAFEPGKPVKLGDEWKPDYDALAKHFSRVWDMQITGRGAEGLCKLDEVTEMKVGTKQVVSSLWMQLKFPVTQAPKDGRGKRHKVTPGTTMTITLQLRLGDAERLPYRQITAGGRYSQKDAGGKGEWNVSVHSWWGAKHDGRIPAPKR